MSTVNKRKRKTKLQNEDVTDKDLEKERKASTVNKRKRKSTYT